MTTDRKEMSGRGQGTNKLDAYNKNSKKAQTGNFMRTFSRTKTSPLITAWNDIHFFSKHNQSFEFLADATGAVDSATVGSTKALALLDILWETYFENANLKDLVTTDEDAWKLYFCAAAQICLDAQIQYNSRCYLPAYTESDTVCGGITAIAYWTQSSYDIFIASMKDFPIPKGIYDLVDIFTTWVIKLTPEYERHTLRIPAAIHSPFMSRYDLADMEAMRGLMRVNLGGMVTHAKKYGLKTQAWRDPVKPEERDLSHPDVIALLNHSPWQWYDNTPAVDKVDCNGGFKGANLTTDYTAHEYMFKDNPNESKIHCLAPMFGTYSGTNNPYGGLIVQNSPNTAEYYVNFNSCAQHGTAMTAGDLGDAVFSDLIIGLYKCTFDNFAATFSINVNGTNFTAAKGLDDAWPLTVSQHLYKGTGRGAIETNNDILNLLGRSLK